MSLASLKMFSVIMVVYFCFIYWPSWSEMIRFILNVFYLLLVVHILIMQSSHSRVVGIVCKNPSCRKPFASMHAYHQHRRHPSKKGTLCANITSMSGIIVDRRANVATAILRREQEPGTKPKAPIFKWWIFCIFFKNMLNILNMDSIKKLHFWNWNPLTFLGYFAIFDHNIAESLLGVPSHY